MGMQRDFWGENGVLGKWPCKETFGLKMGFRGNECGKRLLD